MSRDLRAATQVQHDLLPKELPEALGARFAWHFEPCDELGGDILDFKQWCESVPLADDISVRAIEVEGNR